MLKFSVYLLIIGLGGLAILACVYFGERNQRMSFDWYSISIRAGRRNQNSEGTYNPDINGPCGTCGNCFSRVTRSYREFRESEVESI